ncbi:hypothetical protein THARTR1_09118 [Trichoderma harzianum]|uniref:Uncharacterized protein n=1 Tax=Trichoderma harzianum TaxID=5544 RepID=A0A2K0TX81_TRIHA|nr:hypothetical protein THARTR1_09118 [Trichoderma harzianum]
MAVEEEAMVGVQIDHVLPSLGTALLEIHTGETAMSLELGVAEGAIVAGSGDEVARRLGQRQSDPDLQVAMRLVATEALEALRAAKDHPHDLETRERDPGLLAAMLTDQGDSHAMEGIAVMLEIDAHNLQSAPHLRRSEDGSLPPEVPLQSAKDVTQLHHPPFRGVPRWLVAAAPIAAAIDPSIVLDRIHTRNADKIADEVVRQKSWRMITDATGVVTVVIKIMEPQPRARNLKGRGAIAPLHPRLRQTVASRLILWKMNRVLRIPS